MKLRVKEHRALKWYCEHYNLRPQLSVPPQMYFKDKDGNYFSVDMGQITLEYDHRDQVL